jgi:hypothetical protein
MPSSPRRSALAAQTSRGRWRASAAAAQFNAAGGESPSSTSALSDQRRLSERRGALTGNRSNTTFASHHKRRARKRPSASSAGWAVPKRDRVVASLDPARRAKCERDRGRALEVQFHEAGLLMANQGTGID